MIESTSVPVALEATLLLLVVLTEAAVLYVGYGYVERAIAPRVLWRIRNA